MMHRLRFGTRVRHSASIACLLGCVYNEVAWEEDEKKRPEVRRCGQECNDRFMSIVPVEESLRGSFLKLIALAHESG